MPPKTSSLLYIVIAAAVLAVTIIACTYAFEEIERAHANADAARQSFASVSDKVLLIQQEAQVAVETQSVRSRLGALTIPAGGDANFISSLEALAAAAHVALTISSVSASAPSGTTPGALALTFQITGSWSSLMRFLQLLETESLAQTISSVVFTYDAQAKQWQGVLMLSTLSFDTP